MKFFKFILIIFYTTFLISCGRDGQRERLNNKYKTYPSIEIIELEKEKDYVTVNNN